MNRLGFNLNGNVKNEEMRKYMGRMRSENFWFLHFFLLLYKKGETPKASNLEGGSIRRITVISEDIFSGYELVLDPYGWVWKSIDKL